LGTIIRTGNAKGRLGNVLAAIPKLAADIGMGTVRGFCRILWVFHAILGGLVFLFMGIEGLVDGYLLSFMPLIFGTILFASIIPQISQKLGPLEKGLGFFIVAFISARAAANMEKTDQFAPLQIVGLLAIGVFLYQLVKQLKNADL